MQEYVSGEWKVHCLFKEVYHSLHHCRIQPEVLCEKFYLLVSPTKHPNNCSIIKKSY